MTPRKMGSVGKMGSPGHYKPPKMKMPGLMNMPVHGRVGKMLPSPKKPRPFKRRVG